MYKGRHVGGYTTVPDLLCANQLFEFKSVVSYRLVTLKRVDGWKKAVASKD